MWGPRADRYPEKDKGGVISFSINYPKQAEKFKECDGFFLYETGKETIKSELKRFMLMVKSLIIKKEKI